LPHLAELKKLQWLHLGVKPNVTDEGLKHLSGLPLKTLIINNCPKITKAGTDDLKKAIPGIDVQL